MSCDAPHHPPGRIWYVITAAVAALTFLATADHLPLGSSVRYVEACREMLAAGSWSVPLLGHVPYAEKPILAYWIGMACQALFGDGNLAAHLPSGLAMALLALATVRLGATCLPAGVAGLGGILLLGCVLPLGMVSTFTTDPWLAALVGWSWAAVTAWIGCGRPAGWRRGGAWRWVFWLAAGLATLAKGPVALALIAPGLALGAWAAGGMRGAWRLLLDLAPLRGIAIVAACNLPWVLSVAAHDPRLLWFLYVRTTAQGFLDGRINHSGPWWYYGPALLWTLAPLTAALVPGLVLACWRHLAGARAAGPDSRATITAPALLAGGTLAGLAVLSASGSKLATYLLPLLPLMVVLALTALHRPSRWLGWTTTAGLWATALATATGAIAALAWLAAPDLVPPISDLVVREALDPGQLWAVATGIVLLAIGAGCAAVLAWRGRLVAALVPLAAGFLLLAALVLPRYDRLVPDHDGTRLIAAIRSAGGDPERDLVVFQTAVVHEYSLYRALGRRPVLVGRVRELGMGHAMEASRPEDPLPRDPYGVSGETHPDHPYLTTSGRLVADWAGARRIWIVCEQDYLGFLRTLVPVVEVDRARDLRLLSNR